MKNCYCRAWEMEIFWVPEIIKHQPLFINHESLFKVQKCQHTIEWRTRTNNTYHILHSEIPLASPIHVVRAPTNCTRNKFRDIPCCYFYSGVTNCCCSHRTNISYHLLICITFVRRCGRFLFLPSPLLWLLLVQYCSSFHQQTVGLTLAYPCSECTLSCIVLVQRIQRISRIFVEHKMWFRYFHIVTRATSVQINFATNSIARNARKTKRSRT